jgi:hypothetical protein
MDMISDCKVLLVKYGIDTVKIDSYINKLTGLFEQENV